MTVRVTAVLSGGGVKAAAHLGAVRALHEAGLAPTRYVGTSMGGVIAAMLASGLTPREAFDRAQEIRRRDVARLRKAALVQGLFVEGLLHSEPLKRTIARLVPVATFPALQIPLTLTAASLATGGQVVFGDGGEEAPLRDALYAACALPLWYPPADPEGRRLVDGGVTGPLPLSVAARFSADLVVAVDAGPGADSAPARGRLAPPPLIRNAGDSLGTAMAAITDAEVRLWRARGDLPRLVYVRPVAERGTTFALHHLERYDEAGYASMELALATATAEGLPGR